LRRQQKTLIIFYQGLKTIDMKYFILIGLIFTGIFTAWSQDSSPVKKPALGLHFFYNDFVTAQRIGATSLKDVLKNDQWNQIQNMEGGFGLDYLQGLTKHIDLVGTLNGSWVDYMLPSGVLYGNSNFMLDINAGAHLKLLSDKYIFSPFLIAKAGFIAYKDISGFTLNPGAGFQIHLFKEAFVLTTVEYRTALGNKISNELYYSVGFATSIGKKKPKPPKVEEVVPEPKPVVQEVVIPSVDIIVAVSDEATGIPLPNVEVTISGPEGKNINMFTGEDGKVTFTQISPADYVVRGLLNSINTTVQQVQKQDFAGKENGLGVNLTHNDPRFTLSGIVVNKTKKLPEPGAEITVTNDTRKSVLTKQSREGDGSFFAQLEATSDFHIVGKKAGYISNIERLTTKGLNRSATLYVKLELAIEEAKVGQTIVLNNIYFETGKAIILNGFSPDLEKLVRFMKDNPDTRLEIQGHTDNTGSITLNNKLSQMRADAVVSYLTANSIERGRLVAKGYGPAKPLTSNANTEGRAKNRRVEMKVIQ
jgi:outer membrane protein OmpA-like peptidoglycan-associated protein